MVVASVAAERRVLVVDDDPFVLELVSTRLTLAGYRTYTARDGMEAQARIADVRPEAMVLDINMPRLDGFDLLKGMAASGLTDKVPTMVLSARSQPDDVRKAISLGARDYLSKPFKDDQLIARVGRLFQRRRSANAEESPPADPNTIEI